ncbi:dde superfamily endonuclease [Holotrichia oblita]|uniref:Dde superfamily endonuclease n=1 Tax=Holotrichia oblita TaxID=644536 RepID=A0ACB9SUE8_HOLOL|nr:dde superfamily endonuclease [Holotrichia oblita]
MSDNGWMKSGIFINYIKNVFYPHLKGRGIEFPIILFVDGHQTYLTYELSLLYTNLEIILIALYPNSTRIMQPADVASFRPLKNLWKSKEDFAPILLNAVTLLKPEIARKGFEVCGLHPWNLQAIDYRKCLEKTNGGNTDGELNSDTQHCNKSVKNQKVITFKQFCDIVGANMIQQFERDFNEKFSGPQSFQPDKIIVHENIVLKEAIRDKNVIESEEWENTEIRSSCRELKEEEMSKTKVQLDFFEDSEVKENQAGVQVLFNTVPAKGESALEEENPIKTNNIEDNLPHPKTPQRTGKRQSERAPFVLTFTVYKKMAKVKERAKEEKEKKERGE